MKHMKNFTSGTVHFLLRSDDGKSLCGQEVRFNWQEVDEPVTCQKCLKNMERLGSAVDRS